MAINNKMATSDISNITNLATPVLTSDWVTPAWLSYHYNRSERQIRKWCRYGFLVRRGFIVHQDSNHRWWIRITASSKAPPAKS